MGTLIKNGIDYRGSAVIVDNLNASTGTDTALSAKQGNLLANDLGPIEPNDTSAHAYNVGDLFIWKSQLVKVTASIAVGNTITLGTNVSAISVAEQFEDKADKVSGATNGNLAGLDSSGNLADSGIASDIFPSGASSSDKLVKASENNFKYQNGGSQDLNSITVPGVYSVYVNDSSTQHAPARTEWYTVYVTQSNFDSNYVQQLAVLSADNQWYARRAHGGVWSNWERFVRESECPYGGYKFSGTLGFDDERNGFPVSVTPQKDQLTFVVRDGSNGSIYVIWWNASLFVVGAVISGSQPSSGSWISLQY